MKVRIHIDAQVIDFDYVSPAAVTLEELNEALELEACRQVRRRASKIVLGSKISWPHS